MKLAALEAEIDRQSANVRFGSKADISECPRRVRFTPESGHEVDTLRCPLCAKSGHSSRVLPAPFLSHCGARRLGLSGFKVIAAPQIIQAIRKPKAA